MYKLKYNGEHKGYCNALTRIAAAADYFVNPFRWYIMIKGDYEKNLRLADEYTMRLMKKHDEESITETRQHVFRVEALRTLIYNKLDETNVEKVYKLLSEDEN